MAVADGLRSHARTRPVAITAVLSVVGYALVVGALYGDLPLFPPLSDAMVDLFAHLIAGVNAVALGSLLAGWWFIRTNRVRRHRAAMLTAFSLILLFLVLYLWKVGGGHGKAIVASGLPLVAYRAMLGVHIVLSMVAVPVVLYAAVLGLTRTPAELEDTNHARVGRIAVVAWSLSLFLGIVTYVLLNHAYDSVPREALLLVIATPVSIPTFE